MTARLNGCGYQNIIKEPAIWARLEVKAYRWATVNPEDGVSHQHGREKKAQTSTSKTKPPPPVFEGGATLLATGSSIERLAGPISL
jgi:hypothetical protein